MSIRPNAIEVRGQRRRAPRIPVQWEIEVSDGAGRRWTGTAINVSPLGMEAELTRPLDPHRFLLLSFTPPDGNGPLWVDFAIVWMDSNVAGLQFLNLSPIAAQRLAALMELQDATSPPSPLLPS